MQLHCHSFLLLLIKLIDFSYKTAFPPFYCIISPHPRKLGTNRAVELLAADVEGVEGIGAVGRCSRRSSFDSGCFHQKRCR